MVRIPARSTRDWLFIVRINVYAISLTTLWVPLNTILLPDRVSQIVSETIRASALGLLSFIGIGIAVVIQPFAGWISDHAAFPDRRRPFIVGGTLLDLVFLALVWWAPSFVWLFAAYVCLQVSSNVAQAAFQALIPDLIIRPRRGLASGIKNTFDLLGGALGLVGASLLVGRSGAVYLFIGGLLAMGAGLTALWVPVVPPLAERGNTPRVMPRFGVLAARLIHSLTTHRAFALAVAGRFLFLLGFYPIERFLVYFLQDRFGLVAVAQRASLYVLGATLVGALSAVVAGAISDRVGDLVMLRLSIVVSGLAMVGVALASSLAFLAVAGGLLAIGAGAFQAVNWALLSETMPTRRGGQFYGLANIATAGASALAGLYGPIIDLANARVPSLTYQIVFGLAALLILVSLLPLGAIQLDDH